MAALKSPPMGKALGLDRLPASYYKSMAKILVPRFTEAFNTIADGGVLGEDSLRAHITLIPKEGKNPTTCQNYRPISLLNSDLKLLAKVLAICLAPEMTSLVHYDQVGFIPKKEARDGVIRVLDLIHAAKTQTHPLMLLSLDAETALTGSIGLTWWQHYKR